MPRKRKTDRRKPPSEEPLSESEYRESASLCFRLTTILNHRSNLIKIVKENDLSEPATSLIKADINRIDRTILKHKESIDRIISELEFAESDGAFKFALDHLQKLFINLGSSPAKRKKAWEKYSVNLQSMGPHWPKGKEPKQNAVEWVFYHARDFCWKILYPNDSEDILIIRNISRRVPDITGLDIILKKRVEWARGEFLSAISEAIAEENQASERENSGPRSLAWAVMSKLVNVHTSTVKRWSTEQTKV